LSLPSDWICVLRLASPHGIRGEIKAACFVEEISLLKKFEELKDISGESYRVLSYRIGTKGHVILKIQGLETPEDALKIRGLSLYGPREVLPVLQGEEFYHQDLIGMTTTLKIGQILKVRGVYNFGAGDVLALEAQAPHEGSYMMPFRREAVLEVHLDERTLIINENFLINDKGKD
jgi:16S rRNA processing protein RimM